MEININNIDIFNIPEDIAYNLYDRENANMENAMSGQEKVILYALHNEDNTVMKTAWDFAGKVENGKKVFFRYMYNYLVRTGYIKEAA